MAGESALPGPSALACGDLVFAFSADTQPLGRKGRPHRAGWRSTGATSTPQTRSRDGPHLSGPRPAFGLDLAWRHGGSRRASTSAPRGPRTSSPTSGRGGALILLPASPPGHRRGCRCRDSAFPERRSRSRPSRCAGSRRAATLARLPDGVAGESALRAWRAETSCSRRTPAARRKGRIAAPGRTQRDPRWPTPERTSFRARSGREAVELLPRRRAGRGHRQNQRLRSSFYRIALIDGGAAFGLSAYEIGIATPVSEPLPPSSSARHSGPGESPSSAFP